MKTKCEALEGCNKKARYKHTDLWLKKSVSLCLDHWEQGMKAWLEKDPIIKHLLHEGII